MLAARPARAGATLLRADASGSSTALTAPSAGPTASTTIPKVPRRLLYR